MKLLALIVLFAAPLIAAWVMVEWRIGVPEQRTAHGELRPNIPRLMEWPMAEPLPTLGRGDWVMAFDCSQHCDELADQWWRLHRALGREAPRVSRLRLGGSGEPLPGEALAQWKERPAWYRPGQLWLLDPYGEVVLSYAFSTDPRDILHDVERLLRMNPEQKIELTRH